MLVCVFCCGFFFFTDTATTEIYTYLHTLSLPDALPISPPLQRRGSEPCELCSLVAAGWWLRYAPPAAPPQTPLKRRGLGGCLKFRQAAASLADRKSTRLNSSH